MAGEGQAPTGTTPPPIVSISLQISLGPLSIKYGPPDFLDKLPGIIAELGRFETLLNPPHPAVTQ